MEEKLCRVVQIFNFSNGWENRDIDVFLNKHDLVQYLGLFDSALCMVRLRYSYPGSGYGTHIWVVDCDAFPIPYHCESMLEAMGSLRTYTAAGKAIDQKDVE